jgi:hypothetical protein
LGKIYRIAGDVFDGGKSIVSPLEALGSQSKLFDNEKSETYLEIFLAFIVQSFHNSSSP